MIKKLLHFLCCFQNYQFFKLYIKLNKKIFSKDRSDTSSSSVLLELNNLQSAHIAYSYLSNVLADKNNASINAYIPSHRNNFFAVIFLKIKNFFNLQEFAIYRSFGVRNFLYVRPNKIHRLKARNYFLPIKERIKTKVDVENIKINNVWVGDLFYDTYLRDFREPTIEINRPQFLNFLEESISEFVFWEDYFNEHNISAINVSHCVYNLAIPLRIAISRNIPAFQSNLTHIYKLDSKNYFAYNDFHFFKDIFRELPSKIKKNGLLEAKKRIDKRFLGDVGIDMPYSIKSAYSQSRHHRLIKKSNRVKILIATHCFFDSPHSYGNNLFPDFYEWLNFLGKISESTDYDWYIKTHPDYLVGTKEIIDNFVRSYPKFHLLPSDASHHQIIEEGINLALTVYGTIAFEYAALGIPVINCSLNNPHIAYKFNFHPGSIAEYKSMMMNLYNLNIKIDIQEVYEYYFMKNIYNTENIFFDDYNKTIDAIGGYAFQFSNIVYKNWLDEWTSRKYESIYNALDHFIKSGDFRLDYRHFKSDKKIKL